MNEPTQKDIEAALEHGRWLRTVGALGSESRMLADLAHEIDRLRRGNIKHESKEQPGLFFWAEYNAPARGDGSGSWMVVSQATVDGREYPATEAFDDWFGHFSDADAIARKLANGEQI